MSEIIFGVAAIILYIVVYIVAKAFMPPKKQFTRPYIDEPIDIIDEVTWIIEEPEEE